MAIRQMIAEGFKPPVIIFVQSKARAMDLFRELLFENINVGVITSDRTKAQRDTTVKSFRYSHPLVFFSIHPSFSHTHRHIKHTLSTH